MSTLIDDFKALFPDNLPELKDLTVNDCHGKIESVIANNMAKLTEAQWKAVFDRNFNELFQDGIPHMSWNTDRHQIICRLIEYASRNQFGFKKLCARTYDETWVEVNEMWVQVPCGTVVKCKVEEPHVWQSSSRTRYNGVVVAPEETPKKKTHIAILMACTRYCKAIIVDQFAGSQDECEDWITEQAKKHGDRMPFVKLMKIEDDD